jgi:hypothetical protein
MTRQSAGAARDRDWRHTAAVAIGAVAAVQRRQTNAHALATALTGRGLDDFQQQPGAVLARSALGIGAAVGAIAQKLLQQVAVGGMNLDAVKAR